MANLKKLIFQNCQSSKNFHESFMNWSLGYGQINWRSVMPVKFWQTIVRFWLFFSYLITTVSLSKYWLKKPGTTMLILDFKGHFPDCKRTLLHVECNMQYINKK